MSLILSSEECISVLTGIITPCTGMTNKHMKCANNNKPKPQKKKRIMTHRQCKVEIVQIIQRQVQYLLNTLIRLNRLH